MNTEQKMSSNKSLNIYNENEEDIISNSDSDDEIQNYDLIQELIEPKFFNTKEYNILYVNFVSKQHKPSGIKLEKYFIIAF